MTDSNPSNPIEVASVFSEIEAGLSRLRADRQRLQAERDAERENSRKLNADLERSRSETRSAQLTAAQERARVDRLKAAMAETETHIKDMVDASERQLIDVQVRHDAAIEEWQTRFQRSSEAHERETNQLEREKAGLAREIDALRVELQSVRSRPTDLSSVAARLSRPDSVLVVDGEPLAIMAWPSTPAEARRHRLLSSLERYCVDTRSVADVVFDDPAGTELVANSETVRVRIPHHDLPVDSVMRRLEQTYLELGANVSVVTSRVGSAHQVSASIFAAHIGITTNGSHGTGQPATAPAGTATAGSTDESSRPVEPPTLPPGDRRDTSAIIEAHLGGRQDSRMTQP